MSFDTTYLTAWLKREEGLVLGGAKPCSKGYPTMGYGHRCTAEAEVILSRHMTEDDACMILTGDIGDAVGGASKLFRFRFRWDTLSDARQTAFVAMVFQLGYGTVKTFRRMRQAIWVGNWEIAAQEMLFKDPSRQPGVRSNWYNDSPARVERTADIIRTGVLPPFV